MSVRVCFSYCVAVSSETTVSGSCICGMLTLPSVCAFANLWAASSARPNSRSASPPLFGLSMFVRERERERERESEREHFTWEDAHGASDLCGR